MLKLGYKASAEQFAPGKLLDFSVHAEQAGFESVFVSDHFQPWKHIDGHVDGAEPGDLLAVKIEQIVPASRGFTMILYGMQAPVLVRLKSLASAAFGDPAASVDWCVRLAGGREVVLLAGDQIALRSLEGKQLTKPVGFENYGLGAAAAGAKDELIVAAERAGWIDLYTKEGKFMLIP